MDYVDSFLQRQKQVFYQAYLKYNDGQYQIDVINLVVFLILLILLVCIGWIPFIFYLSKTIWRTKGMLGIIPSDIILIDQNIKKLLIKEDLLKAVK